MGIKWYAERNFTEQLHEDLRIGRLILNELTRAGISRIELERSANKVDVTLHTSKPGIVIGKQGANVERLRQMLEQGSTRRCTCGSKRSRCRRSMPSSRRASPSRSRAVLPIAGDEARRAASDAPGSEGVKDHAIGATRCAEMSRSVTEMDGRVPRSTLRADIDFGVVHAHTTYGRIGVKVWVYKGEVLPERAPVTAATLTADLAAITGD